MPQEPRPGPLIDAIHNQLASLSRNERRVAELILAEPTELLYRSLGEVAKLSDTSDATVIRCCHALGLRGFQDLKARLSQDALVADGNGAVNDDDSPTDVMLKMLGSAAAAVTAARESVDRRAFARAARLLGSAERVLFVGSTPSGLLAQYAGFRFMELGGQAIVPVDPAVQHLAAEHLTAADACLAVSHTGATREVLTAVGAAAQKGAKTILISSFFRSPVADIVDITLCAGNYETSFHRQAMAARAVQIALIDALIVSAGMSNRSRFVAAQHRSAAAAATHRV